jgi:heterodisulfide reductase subunit A-like polyferredoxin
MSAASQLLLVVGAGLTGSTPANRVASAGLSSVLLEGAA